MLRGTRKLSGSSIADRKFAGGIVLWTRIMTLKDLQVRAAALVRIARIHRKQEQWNQALEDYATGTVPDEKVYFADWSR